MSGLKLVAYGSRHPNKPNQTRMVFTQTARGEVFVVQYCNQPYWRKNPEKPDVLRGREHWSLNLSKYYDPKNRRPWNANLKGQLEAFYGWYAGAELEFQAEELQYWRVTGPLRQFFSPVFDILNPCVFMAVDPTYTRKNIMSTLWQALDFSKARERFSKGHPIVPRYSWEVEPEDQGIHKIDWTNPSTVHVFHRWEDAAHNTVWDTYCILNLPTSKNLRRHFLDRSTVKRCPQRQPLQ